VTAITPAAAGDAGPRTHLSGVGGDLFGAAQAFGIDDIQVADTILDATPPLDAVPAYPPWPGSPAAGPGSG
jgi:hypothetical protein